MDRTPLYVGFSQGRGLVPNLIQLFTGRGVNHAFFAWEDPHIGWLALGANANGVTVDAWHTFTQNRYVPALFSERYEQHLWDGLAKLRDKLNEKYAFLALAGMSIVEIARVHQKFIANPLPQWHATFCSQFVVDVMRAALYEVLGNQPSNTIDPRQLMHWMAGQPDLFTERSAP